MPLLIVLLAACLAVMPVAAEPGSLQQLQQRLAGINSLSGAFDQQIISEEGRLLERSSGQFRLLKPGYFSWHILEPDEQLLVAAGSSLWHYDVELETATRRDIPVDDSSSPLAILGGDAGQLGQQYRVQALGPQSWRLQPLAEQAEFTVIDISFADELPVRMEIRDALQRLTVIRFNEVRAGGLKPEDFEFSPPAGVDVYDNE